MTRPPIPPLRPLPPPRPGFFRQTPPAIFVPMFGLFGLGLAWRRAEVVFVLPQGLGDTILGAVTLLAVGAVGLPATLFLAADGTLAGSHLGEISREVLAQKIQELKSEEGISE